MLDYKKEYQRWLTSDALSAEEKAELQAISGDEKEIESRFYGPLEFGTAGLRGTMKVGLHQMNIHVIRWATQGFADVIAAEGEEAKKKGVAICMDCRVNSMAFARAAAEVCAANGIHVRIFESLRPTPELSFAVRYYGCQAGINVTASQGVQRLQGLLGRRRPAAAPARRRHRRPPGADRHLLRREARGLRHRAGRRPHRAAGRGDG